MKHVIVHLTDPWTGRDVTRDVGALSRAQLERYAGVVRSAAFRGLAQEAADATPGELLAAWVEHVGPVHAGAVLLRRRAGWVNAGAAVGAVLGAFLLGWLVGAAVRLPQYLAPGTADKNAIDLLRAYLQAHAPQLAGTLTTWGVVVALFVAPIVLGLLLGAGAGWFAAGLIDSWAHRRARGRARRG